MPLWPLLLLAYQAPATFQSEVSLVQVDAEVLHDKRLVDGLKKDDFRITDGGRPQEILYFGKEEEPLDLILVLDVSPSMARVIRAVADGADIALRQLQPGDRVAVMVFDHGVLMDFTDDFPEVGNKIRREAMRTMSTSRIQKAVDEAALHFLKQPRTRRRRAVLVITDNRGSTNTGRALTDLWEANAVLSGLVVIERASVAVFSVMQPQSLFIGGIGNLVEKTGGDIVNLGVNVNDTGDGLRRVIERLRMRYSLHYAMPQAKPGEQRKIKVELAPESARKYPGADVHARTGYIVPAAR